MSILDEDEDEDEGEGEGKDEEAGFEDERNAARVPRSSSSELDIVGWKNKEAFYSFRVVSFL